MKNIGIDLFKNIMAECRHDYTLLDSFSPNQFKSKENLIKHIEDLKILNEKSEIVIFGAWFGGILIPAFDYVHKITAIDMDEEVISVAKNRLFNNYTNIDFIADDIFNTYRDQYKSANLFINTSCEHMLPMKEWGPWPKYTNPWWDRVAPAYFAFQSNNMFGIPTHINCVNSLEEFKEQMPNNSNIIIEDEVTDDRGTRFTLIGQICAEQS